jgi:adenine-specific DNA-methyltransferase
MSATTSEVLLICLSVRNPWAYLICHGVKDIEYRSKRTSHRGRFYIHVSGPAFSAADALGAEPDKMVWRGSPELMKLLRGAEGDSSRPIFPSGCIIGHVDLIEVEEYGEKDFGWVLENPVLLSEPIVGVKGVLGFWKYDPRGERAPEPDVDESVPEAEESMPIEIRDIPFVTTDYHARIWAWNLTRKTATPTYETLAGSIMGAQVDLNPHQIDAALFALKSPLSRGVLLADEVGLGKTIEAGIVLSQKWAENKRRLLLILPASLRKQWLTELSEKFYLPGFIMEKKSFDQQLKAGEANPFDQPGQIVITSYQFAAAKAEWIQKVGWDLMVIDEAHRVRNSWKKDSVTGQALRKATENKRKLLLTATPLQNSMMELFGLLSFIDPQAFGDESSFKLQYLRLAEEGKFEELRKRIAPFCFRTLRRQVIEYIRYTKRICITQTFEPGEDEQGLYDDISAWLQRPELLALPPGPRQLMTLLLRKLLASSTYAIAGAFDTTIARLEGKKEGLEAAQFIDEIDGLDEDIEEWADEDSPATKVDPLRLGAEIEELKAFRDRARAIGDNAKGLKLLTALGLGFTELARLGAEEKAIIFTESRKTQNYILGILSQSPYAGEVVLFNGTNSDAASKAIYREWLAANKGSDRVSGSPSSDMRAALVDRFRGEARIMIATEAAAEGVNLQFCSLIINYDLPWNPQRIEQRIGRCHRYGQKFDVVVINFLNKKNEADKRVYELLSEKFRLFDGVFGASDEILGSIGSGMDFEKRILEIYQTCRDPDSIAKAFDSLQSEFSDAIDERMNDTKRKLMENFDDEVRQRLKLREEEALKLRSSHEKSLFYLTRHILGNLASFDDTNWTFSYQGKRYGFDASTPGTDHVYRLGQALAQQLLFQARDFATPEAHITFQYSGKEHIGAVRALVGKEGYVQAALLRTESEETMDEELLLACVLDDGNPVPSKAALKLFQTGGLVVDSPIPEAPLDLDLQMERLRKGAFAEAQEKSRLWLEQEIDKLDAWADDLKSGLELRIKEIELQIRQVKRAKALATGLQEKLAFEREYKALEKDRTAQRRRLFEAQDEIDAKRDEVISSIENRLKAKESLLPLFRIGFSVTNTVGGRG